MNIRQFPIILISTVTILLSACKKDSSSSTLHVRLTDAPTALDEVNVDLVQVNVKFASDSAGWVSLQTKPGIYNLLGLQNGVDTLIAQGTFPSNEVKEIRLVLGSRNSVVADGKSFPLTIPSGSESGLKIKVNKHLAATLETLLIDFDAALSIKLESGGYKLRPVLRIK
jgi:hypothetical protein